MELFSVTHEDQIFTYTDHIKTFPAHATAVLRSLLARWVKIFPYEETLIQTRHNVPSLFVRFDCVVTPDNHVFVYEIQEGCAWVGYTGIANEAFRTVRDEIVQEDWPHLGVVRSNHQTDKDDDLWLPRVGFWNAAETPFPLVVRNRMPLLPPTQRALIIRKSVRPVLNHNNKQYGVDLGLWKMVNWENTTGGEDLPWDRAFVLKPQSGFGSKDIMIWKPDDRSGRATKTQIMRVLREYNSMFFQDFIPPMHMDIDRKPYHFIYRPYFMYSARKGGYVPAHGLWAARPAPNIRIHGTSDTVSGPLIMERWSSDFSQ